MLDNIEMVIPASGMRETWKALLELSPCMGDDWILIGGQMVAVYATKQPNIIMRNTTDADIVIDLRANNKGFDHIDKLLTSAGFVQEVSTRSGIGHRYIRGTATFDILAPDKIGRRNPLKLGHGRSVPVMGSTRALARAHKINIKLENMSAPIRVPSPVGALVLKGSALYYNLSGFDRSTSRHREDIHTLLTCCELSFAELPLSKSERKILNLIANDQRILEVSRDRVNVFINQKSVNKNTFRYHVDSIAQTLPAVTVSKQCKYITKKNNRCKNQTTHISEVCYKHR